MMVKLGTVELLQVPINQIEGIIVYSGVDLSNRLITILLENAIPVTFLSTRGKYFGRLETVKTVNIDRQIKQFELMKDDNFNLKLSRRVISAKVKNSLTVIKEFSRHHPAFDIDTVKDEICIILRNIENCENLSSLIGYEGQAARIHYSSLSALVNEDYKFSGRSRQPPRDPFNSMLSYGYTLLMFDTYTHLQAHGLNPYLGFLHKPKNGHAALASDLMELWRSVLVDAFVLHQANRNVFKVADFETDDRGGVYLNNDKSKLFLRRYEDRVKRTKRGIDGKEEFCYRLALEKMVLSYVRSVEFADPEMFETYLLR
jgi:CRISPR-associated protein Cas1